MPGTRSAHAAPPARPLVRSFRLLVPAVALLVLASGCGSSESLSGDVVKDGIGCQPSEVARDTAAPVVPARYKVGKKTATRDQKKGKGCPADTTSFLTLDMVGAIASTGKVFTSTWTTGHPLTVQLGKGQLIVGLETGLTGMKVGGRRIVSVPAVDGYGEAGSPDQNIGKNVDLVFVADLVAVTTSPIYCAAASGIPSEVGGKPIKGKPVADLKMPLKVPTDKVGTHDIKVGTGAKVTDKDYVKVNYYGVSCLTGHQFATSWEGDGAGPFEAALAKAPASAAAGSVIPGWTQGLVGARVGGIRQIDIPYAQAYGSAGRDSGDLGPKASLVFVIQIISASEKAPKPPPTTTTTAPAGSTTTTTAATTTTTEATTTTTTAKKK